MTPRTVRAVQRGLLLLVVLVVGLVLLNLRRPTPAASPAPTPSLPEAPPRGAQVAGGFHYEQKKYDPKKGEEKVSFVLDAESMVGQEQQDVRLKGVRMQFPYAARGETGSATITSDDCLYTPGAQKGVFRGHVVVRTADGGELRSESLVYRGDKGVARTDSPVEFGRKQISGQATGMSWESKSGALELMADVLVRVERAGEPPLEIRADRASGDREDGTLHFEGASEARQGQDVLKSDELVVSFDTGTEALVGFTAAGHVDLESTGGQALPGMAVPAAQGKGRRVLKCQILDVLYRDGRTVERANAGPFAELTAVSPRAAGQERSRLAARVLTFMFDDQGRLVQISGQKDSSLATEILPARPGAVARTARCRRFVARFDPETGEARAIDFIGDVEMTRGTQRSRSDRGWYRAKRQQLALEGRPELVDTGDGSRLTARRIEIGAESGDVAATDDVTHILGRKPGTKPRGLLGSRDEPTLVTCRRFHYTAGTREAHYEEDALARSAQDEIRAPTIVIRSDAAGNRHLDAGDGVASLFHPQGDPGKPPPAPVEVHAQKLAYDEARRQAVYDGDVQMRQGDLNSRSPSATLTLTPDGSAIETMVAGEPVEIDQGARKATGTKATYTPGKGTVVIVGDQVVLTDPGQQVKGRSLTFHLGDDRILVDGREEVRTETILKKEPPTP